MILCCGDALVDMVPTTLPGGERAYRPLAGGSCLNVAVALARLGSAAGFVGGLSRDFLGDMLRARLAAEGLDLARASLFDDETTLGLVSLDEGPPRYVFYDRSSAARRWAPSPAALDLAGVEAVHLGSVTLIGEPSAGNFEAYGRHAAAHCVVTLDPNCRPTLVDDIGAYRARIGRMARCSDIVRMSDEDARFLYPGRPCEDVANELLGNGVALVVVTRGERGASAFSASAGVAERPAVPVAVADTIGAGDAFMAALLTRLSETGRLSRQGLRALREEELTAALAYCVRAAAVACSRQGADPPYRTELESTAPARPDA